MQGDELEMGEMGGEVEEGFSPSSKKGSKKGGSSPGSEGGFSPSTKEEGKSLRKGRSRRFKKQKIELSLWINHTKYEFNLLCTFCTKQPAVCHCPECPDFYCKACDGTAHKTKKRQGHERTALSKLDLFTAASIITRAVRRYGHIRMIQAKCRAIFRRFFDRTTLNYYYYNPVYNSTSWRKPYCLRKLEFAPYMPPPYAASKCQNLYHLWRARQKSREAIKSQFQKIFDRKGGYFYYAYNGKSQLQPRQSWIKPRFLGKRSFPKDILPIFTIDVAAIVIQRKWRAILVRQFLRALVRATHDEVWDPVKGRYNYYNRDSEVLFQEKPLLLGKEEWDPNRVHDWDLERVSLFLRRIGLKQYVQIFHNYAVDGRSLILLDEEDYENLYVTNRVHIRKIQVEIRRIYVYSGPVIHMSEDHAARREKIRRKKMYHAAAVFCQKHFRIFSARRKVSVLREVRRINLEASLAADLLAKSDTWYTMKDNLPSRDAAVAGGWGEVEGVRLPPIKAFGRHRDHLSFQGWGRKQGGQVAGEGQWSPTKAAVLDKNFRGDAHLSGVFTQKLHVNGYDATRMGKFKQQQTHLNSA